MAIEIKTEHERRRKKKDHARLLALTLRVCSAYCFRVFIIEIQKISPIFHSSKIYILQKLKYKLETLRSCHEMLAIYSEVG